ncbi:MAG: hypothetical protein JRG91_11590, partial [Deltaproteobacteria bacterium]|nr:hypothetical protein [Deltaproteobacteria bacterium]
MRIPAITAALGLALATPLALALDEDPARDLIAPLCVGSELDGGFTVTSLGPSDDHAIRIGISDGTIDARVVFYRLDRASPAFLRTLHCNVIYELEVQSSDETPAPLAAAV